MSTDNLVKYNNRIVWIDLLRIVSAFAVIVIHVSVNQKTWNMHLFDTFSWEILNVTICLSRFCVPVFLMISGYFFLSNDKAYSIKEIYTQKIKKLFILFVFWSFIYCLLRIVLDHPFENISEIFSYIFDGGIWHTWYIPVLIFLYMISPLLKEICRDKNNEIYFLILCSVPLIINTISPFFMPPWIESLIDNTKIDFISGYTFYYVAGHFIINYDIKKTTKWIFYIMNIVFSALNIILMSFSYKNSKILYFNNWYLTFFVAFFGITVLLFFKNEVSKIRFSDKSERIIRKLSSLTLGIYLIHMIFVYYVDISVFESIPNVIVSVVFSTFVFCASAVSVFLIKKIPVFKKYIV